MILKRLTASNFLLAPPVQHSARQLSGRVRLLSGVTLRSGNTLLAAPVEAWQIVTLCLGGRGEIGVGQRQVDFETVGLCDFPGRADKQLKAIVLKVAEVDRLGIAVRNSLNPGCAADKRRVKKAQVSERLETRQAT